MASLTTNKGKWRMLGWIFVAVAEPVTFDVVLCLTTLVPTVDTDVVSTYQIATGNGYVDGGYSLTPGGTDYDVDTEDDTNDWGLVQAKDIVWTAAGGPIPSSGLGARYAAHCDDNATTTLKEIVHVWDLVSERTISDTQTLTLQDCEARIT